MTLREYQADFTGGNVEGTSYTTRPDAVAKNLWAISPGPRSLSDPTDGLLVKGWYCRVDLTTKQVFLGEAKDQVRLGWNAEVELFTYTGADLEEVDLCFDQNGQAFFVAERGGDLWIRYFKPSAGSFVFENFGPARHPRCILDDPLVTDQSDILVFYKAGGTLRWREQNDLYATEQDTTHPLGVNQFIEGTVRSEAYRIHIIVSERDPSPGQYSLSRITSKLYTIPIPPEELQVSNRAVAGEIELVIHTAEGQTEELDVAHTTPHVLLAVVVWDEGMTDSFDLGTASVEPDLIVTVIEYEGSVEELDVDHASLAGDVVLVIITYTAAEEELDVEHTSQAGLLEVV